MGGARRGRGGAAHGWRGPPPRRSAREGSRLTRPPCLPVRGARSGRIIGAWNYTAASGRHMGWKVWGPSHAPRQSDIPPGRRAQGPAGCRAGPRRPPRTPPPTGAGSTALAGETALDTIQPIPRYHTPHSPRPEPSHRAGARSGTPAFPLRTSPASARPAMGRWRSVIAAALLAALLGAQASHLRRYRRAPPHALRARRRACAGAPAPAQMH
jgi:hypothetical protein